MAHEPLIDRVEQAASEAEARAVLRPHRGQAGLSESYFGRLLQCYAGDPARAQRLAARWRIFLDLGDDPALAYRAKGAADRMAGRWHASARAFLRAGELAEDESNRRAYALGAIDALAKAGKVDEAAALGERLARELDALAQAPLAARARLNAGNALLWAERGREARAYYDRAIPAFVEHEMATEEAAARLGRSAAHLYNGDPSIAAEDALRAKAIAHEQGLDYLAALCDLNLAHAELVQGRADEAFAILLTARPALEDSPADRARVDMFLGDASLRLNLLAEAVEAYSSAWEARSALPLTDRADVLLGLGEAKTDDGPAAADRHLAEAARRYAAIGNRFWRSATLAARAELRVREGWPRARSLAEEALRSAKGSPYHETLALIACVVAGSEAVKLRGATAHVRRYGYRRFAWRIHALNAAHSKRPLPHYRRMFGEILRDRLATSSVAARASFLRDKSSALSLYLDALLREPTSRRVEEAREVIVRTRSAALLDEILSSDRLRLKPDQTTRLESLRAEILAEDSSGGTSDVRRAVGSVTAVPLVRRHWMESTHVLGVLDTLAPPQGGRSATLLAETGETLRALIGDRAIRLPISTQELADTARWLRFEISTPMADRDAPSDEACAALREIAERIVLPWSRFVDEVRICPDGVFWGLPWDGLLAALGDQRPATLLLHPSMAGPAGDEPLYQRVAVWIDAADDLPYAHRELASILDRFPEAQVLRTRAEILASFGHPWDLIHVVGHARHNAGNPMFSHLRFADGPIYATEIARSLLRVSTVMLSACETGALSLTVREEPDGLVRAFLARGARSVLASLWPLDDEAAARFFSALYAKLDHTEGLPGAIATARSQVRAWRDHPYFWASLTLFGGYRS